MNCKRCESGIGQGQEEVFNDVVSATAHGVPGRRRGRVRRFDIVKWKRLTHLVVLQRDVTASNNGMN